MADREHLRANPRYHDVAAQLEGDPLFFRIWQTAQASSRMIAEEYFGTELPFAFEPKYITTERDPERTDDYPAEYESTIPYGTRLVLVCKFPSIAAAENEVVELRTDDPDLALSGDELLILAEIATSSTQEHRYI